MEQVSMVRVHQDRICLRQSSCDAAETSGFGRVGVNDVGTKRPDFFDKCAEGFYVICWSDASTESGDSKC